MKACIQNTILTTLVLATWSQAVAQAVQDAGDAHPATLYIGYCLSVTNGGPDGIPPLVILGEYSSIAPHHRHAHLRSQEESL